MPRLNDTLRALADADARVTIPAAVHDRVMREWDASHAPVERRTRFLPRAARPHSRVRWAAMWLLAAAAAIVLLAVVPRTPRSAPRPLEVAGHPGILVAPPLAATTAHAAALDSTSATTPRRARRVRAARHSIPARDDVGLMLIADPMFDSSAATIVRVRMPRSALASLGLPIADPGAGGDVDVEMIVGEDGVARTIRRAKAAPATHDWE
jgi:hypothetical protein